MLACNREGELPLLFNGGIFTTDNNGRIKGNNNDELPTFEGQPATPDFRRWMGCHFMSQNQRWLGWPALAGGDADLLAPSLTFYRDYNKWEPIEMYACGPYRLVGITRSETLQLARDTWETVPADRARLCKQDYSWMANVANMAALAWPEEAKKRAI